MSAHTPGPWFPLWNQQNKRTGIGVWNVIAEQGGHLLTHRVKAGLSTQVAVDVRLMAAAPDLLAACKAALNALNDEAEVQARKSEDGTCRNSQFEYRTRAALCAAIAKAEGCA